MNIFQTFELFLKKPISLLKHGLVSIVHLKADNIFSKTAITADMMDGKAQITVINNEKVYNLLKMVTYRASKKQKLPEKKDEPVKSETLYEYAGTDKEE